MRALAIGARRRRLEWRTGCRRVLRLARNPVYPAVRRFPSVVSPRNRKLAAFPSVAARRWMLRRSHRGRSRREGSEFVRASLAAANYHPKLTARARVLPMQRSPRRARRSLAALRAPRRLCRRPGRRKRKDDSFLPSPFLLQSAPSGTPRRSAEARRRSTDLPRGERVRVVRGRDRAEPEQYRAWRTAPLTSP